MLTPSEIELLRQDLQAALEVAGPDEIDDAHGLIRKHGFRKSDFEIIQRGDTSRPYPSAVTGVVAVRRRSTETARGYRAGSRSSWLQQLDHDLASGTFGSP